MDDLISRQAATQTALDFIVEYLGGAFDEDFQKKLMERMNALPSAQPERKKGEWADNNDMWMCNICCKWIDILQGDADMNFCPNCGADMRGEKRVND